MRQDYLVLKGLFKVFGSGEGAVTAVDNVNIEVKEGELVTLLGPSGCGKTTTLRMIEHDAAQPQTNHDGIPELCPLPTPVGI
jgi:ABC-type multidrug transport system ATPase subunit